MSEWTSECTSHWKSANTGVSQWVSEHKIQHLHAEATNWLHTRVSEKAGQWVNELKSQQANAWASEWLWKAASERRLVEPMQEAQRKVSERAGQTKAWSNSREGKFMCVYFGLSKRETDSEWDRLTLPAKTDRTPPLYTRCDSLCFSDWQPELKASLWPASVSATEACHRQTHKITMIKLENRVNLLPWAGWRESPTEGWRMFPGDKVGKDWEVEASSSLTFSPNGRIYSTVCNCNKLSPLINFIRDCLC